LRLIWQGVMNFRESDMYAPLKAHFEGLGYAVKGEVKGIDMVLMKDNALIVVEMKKSFNMSLLFQAVKRQSTAAAVFVAIPRKAFESERVQILQILEKLEFGLVTVAMDSPMRLVEVHLAPNMKASRNTKAAKALIAEFSGRIFDADNIGGSSGVKIMTAHKERSLQIACALKALGTASPAQLVRDYGCYEKTGQILRSNFYGWFEKIDKGKYALSKLGEAVLDDPAFAGIVAFYNKEVKL